MNAWMLLAPLWFDEIVVLGRTCSYDGCRDVVVHAMMRPGRERREMCTAHRDYWARVADHMGFVLWSESVPVQAMPDRRDAERRRHRHQPRADDGPSDPLVQARARSAVSAWSRQLRAIRCAIVRAPRTGLVVSFEGRIIRAGLEQAPVGRYWARRLRLDARLGRRVRLSVRRPVVFA